MLAGLIFATSDAADRPDALTATLPFGGASLIEFQARLLMAAGAAQIMIAVTRVTPELLGAANRIAKRGVAVDVVRSAAEAAAKVHPLAGIVVLADGLVTTEAQLGPFTGEGGELLLVTDEDNGLERLDASSRWAGIARIGAQRLTETAALPRDYDFLSTLVRVTAQHGAAKLSLKGGQTREGQGVEHDASGLARRGRAIFASLAGDRVRWVDRWVFGPLARVALPPLVAKGASPLALIGGGVGIAAAGLFGIWSGWVAPGLGGIGVATGLFALGGMLAWLRGDDGETAVSDHAASAVAAAAVFLTGFVEDSSRGGMTGSVLAIALVVAGALVERIATPVQPRAWWASPAAYPLLLIPFAAAGQTLAGLAALGLYAAGSLLNGIERLRAKP